MKNRGFTLVELLGTVMLLSAIILFTIPPIIDYLRRARTEIDKASLQIIYTGADQYISSNQNSYPKVNGNTYCITLQQIVNDGKLTAPIKNTSTNKDIPLTKYVEVKVSSKKYSYLLVDTCTPS